MQKCAGESFHEVNKPEQIWRGFPGQLMYMVCIHKEVLMDSVIFASTILDTIVQEQYETLFLRS
jgi:hypothetical protein